MHGACNAYLVIQTGFEQLHILRFIKLPKLQIGKCVDENKDSGWTQHNALMFIID